MTWRTIFSSGNFGIQWHKIFPMSAVDPYLVWAELTSFKGVSKSSSEFLLQIAFETKKPGALGRLQGLFRGAPVVRITDSIYATHLPATAQTIQILYSEDARALVSRFIMGMPVENGLQPGFFNAARRSISRDAVMAVIDDGCAFAHDHFRKYTGTRWKSRVRGLWDQNPGSNPTAAQGRAFSRAELESIVNAAGSAAEVDEEACYRSLSAGFSATYATDYLLQLRKAASHGTHVLDLAAGDPNPLAGAGLGESNDPAAKADIFFVQLPHATVKDTSGGSLDVYVLLALAYLRSMNPQRKIVVNLSYGSYGGPHDGNTLLERAMDAFASNSSLAEIVVPAGNAYDARIHAAVKVEGGQTDSISIHVQPDSVTDTFVEFWYPSNIPGASETIEFEVIPPVEGAESGRCELNSVHLWFRPTPSDPAPVEPTAGVIHVKSPSSGTDKSMALLAIAPTAEVTPPRPRAPHGKWTVKIFNTSAQPHAVDVRAWVERDDASFGSGRSQAQADFLSAGLGPSPGEPHAASDPIVRESNLNSIGHGEKTRVVGGYVARQERMAKYSASGPSIAPDTREHPDLVTPCEESEVLNGLLAAGNRTGIHFRMNGTSVASPVLARALLNMSLSGTKGQPPTVQLPLEPLPPSHPPVDPTLREGAGRLD